jgi:ribosomal protein S6
LNAYKVMFIFLTSLDEEAREGVMANVGEEIAALGGKIHGSDFLGRQTFNRPMRGHTDGNYVRARVELDPTQVDPLLARLKLNGDVFRVQVLRAQTLELAGVEAEPEPVEVAAGEKAKGDGELQ